MDLPFMQELNPVDPTPVIEKVLEFGILGVVLLLLIFWIWKQDKDAKSSSISFKNERKNHQDQLEKERLEWVEERKDWNARLQQVVNNHIADIEKHGQARSEMISKYHHFVNTINDFIKMNNTKT